MEQEALLSSAELRIDSSSVFASDQQTFKHGGLLIALRGGSHVSESHELRR
jgi:hypothetical protein